MADFNVTECVIENVNGAAFLRPQKSYSIVIDAVSTTSSIPISANTQVVRLATPSSCHFRLGAGATTSDAMVPAGEVVDFAVQPDGGTSYLSVIEASSPTDIGGGGVGDSGLESVNVETLVGNKTITSVDARVQLLNPGGASRNVTLDASLHVVGTTIKIVNTDGTGGVYNYGGIMVKNSAGSSLASDYILYGGSLTFLYTGTGANGWMRTDGIEGGQSEGGVLSFNHDVIYTSKTVTNSTGFGVGDGPSSIFHVTAAGNANALRVDNTTGRVGIGAAPGNQQLYVSGTTHLYGDISTQSSTFYAYDSAALNAAKQYAIKGLDYAGSAWLNVISYNVGNGFQDIVVGSASMGTGTIYLWTAGGYRVVANTTGVGIGATPSSLFHVTASGNANALRVDNTTGVVSIGQAPSSDYQLLVQTQAARHGMAIWNTPTNYWAYSFTHTGGSYASGFSVNGSNTGSLLLSNEAGVNAVQMYPHSSSGFNTLLNSTGIGATPSSLFHVTASGNANALRVDNTTGRVSVWGDSGYGALCIYTDQGETREIDMGAGRGGGIRVYQSGNPTIQVSLYTRSASTITERLTIDKDGIITCPSTTGAFSPPVLTTTQRDALTAVKGMLIYNSTTDKHQGYNGAWTDFY